MASPYVTMDLDKIRHNAGSVVDLCQQHGMTVTGVTKGVCGHPEIAKAMLEGGVTAIGDSRLVNIQRLRAAGVEASYMLIRLPPLSAVDAVVESVDVSLNSELATLAALSAAARRRNRVHDVILMVDLGDLREGLWPDDVIPVVREVVRLTGIRLIGLGTNLACFGGVVPSERNMSQLLELVREVETAFGLRIGCVSAGNSSQLELMRTGRMPAGINHARIGEGILLGRETIHRAPWPDTHQDAFVLYAEVLEVKQKPSVPLGDTGEDAFGEHPVFNDEGAIHRAVLNVGREDIDLVGVTPLDGRFRVLGASSGYLILDVSAAPQCVRVGAEIGFSLNYAALLAAMTSEYVEKRPVSGSTTVSGPHATLGAAR